MTDIATIKKTITPIARAYGVKRIYLFGSYAKGSANENSDVDLLVEKGKPMSLLKLSGMRQSVQEALELSVDLVTTAGIEDEFYREIASPVEEDEYLTRNSEFFHESIGYKLVARYHECGSKFGKWYNLIEMEKIIGERTCPPKEFVPFEKFVNKKGIIETLWRRI